MAGTIGSYKSLYVVISSVDGTTTFLDNTIFGLDFFEQMRYFGGQVRDYRRFNGGKRSIKVVCESYHFARNPPRQWPHPQPKTSRPRKIGEK